MKGSVQGENGRKALQYVRVPSSEPGCTKLFCPAAFRPATPRLESNSPAREIVYGRSRGLAAAFAPYSAKKQDGTGPSLRAVEGREGESKWALVMRGRRDKVSSERSVSVGPLRAVLLRAEKNAEKECLSSLFLPPRSAAETLPCGTANPVMYDRPQWWPETSRPPRTRGSRLTGGRAGRRG